MDGDCLYALVFVDDIIVAGKLLKNITKIKDELKRKFVVKDLGKIKSYIGIDVEYNKKEKKMFLSQSSCIQSLVDKYELKDAKLFETPMEENLKLDQAKRTDERIKYRNLIGELLYISSGTRPDIAFSVNYLSRYQNCYDYSHYKYALRVLKYLYETKDKKLYYGINKYYGNIDCFVDSDFAGDKIDRKSTSGYLVRFNGNVIFWKSRKQNIVTKCSTFAEYVALSEAVTEVLFIRNVCDEMFNVDVNEPINFYEDNSGAVSIAKFGNFTKNSKHIEIQYLYINEHYCNGVIDIIKVKSDENIADILTKALSKDKFVKNRSRLKLI